MQASCSQLSETTCSQPMTLSSPSAPRFQVVLSGNAHHLPPEAPGGNAVAVGPGGAVAAAAAAEQQHPLRLYWEYLSFLFRCAGV